MAIAVGRCALLAKSNGRKRILVLDYDADRLILIERMLETAGYETITTWDLGEARELLGGNNFNLVLIGEHPPDISSTDVLNTVWTHRPTIPCVVMRSAPSWFEVENRCPAASPSVSRCTLAEVVDRIKRLLDVSSTDTNGAVA